MNTLNIVLSYSYISNLVNLNWYDILFAIEENFLPSNAAIEHAIAELENDENPVKDVVDLIELQVPQNIMILLINK